MSLRIRDRWSAAVLAVAMLVLGGLGGWWLAERSRPDLPASIGSPGAAPEPPGGMAGMPEMDGGGAVAGAPPEDAHVVSVDPGRLQRIGVRYAVAERAPLGRTVRAEAAVIYDETRRVEVTTKVPGWLERLYVDRPGQSVRRGQPLLEIYSPELVSTQRELVLALQHAARTGAPPAGDAGHAHDATDAALSPAALVEAARQRLALWDVPASQIERLERTREVRRTVTLAAPAAGVVVEKDVLAGARVEAGERLYVIADLSTVWIEGRVFERDLAAIAPGAKAAVELSGYPGERFEGRVTFVYPWLDPESRTVAVRLVVPNPDGRLKPGMFATATFDVAGEAPVVVVPSAAVVETGERSFVLLKRGEGLFEPREVAVGGRAGERVAVTEGLAAGDTVVASANFLIDSEADLMAFMGGMGMSMDGSMPAAPAPASSPVGDARPEAATPGRVSPPAGDVRPEAPTADSAAAAATPRHEPR